MSTHFETNEAARDNRKWVVLDAEGEIVGRLAARIASILRGKTNPKFTPHNDCGDFVVVLNAAKIRFSGGKMEKKLYRHYTTYIGGLREERADSLFERKPEELLRRAVQGMLPKTPLGRKQLMKLKIYADGKHPHQSQISGTAAQPQA